MQTRTQQVINDNRKKGLYYIYKIFPKSQEKQKNSLWKNYSVDIVYCKP